MSYFPKILFIADEIPQSINAGSIQFLRLFKDYPSDKIVVIGKPPDKEAETLNCKYYTLPTPLIERIRLSRFMRCLTDLQSLGLGLPRLSKKLEQVADEFNPDIVISLMQLLPFYFAAYKYAKKKNVSFILFCHDDVEDFAKPHYFFKRILVNLNAKIYRFATKRICISPEMAKAWETKYGAKGDFIYPIASEKISIRDISDAKKLVCEDQLTIGYAGSLAYGYREGINEIIPILEKTGSRLKIYRDGDNDIKDSISIEFTGYASTPEETWNRVISECDAVILPYSREIRFEKLYRTHFPSKLSEYLKLQIPIIITGPPYANGLRYGEDKNYIITAITDQQLEKEIKKLKDSTQYRLIVSNNQNKINDCLFNNSFSELLKHFI